MTPQNSTYDHAQPDKNNVWLTLHPLHDALIEENLCPWCLSQLDYNACCTADCGFLGDKVDNEESN